MRVEDPLFPQHTARRQIPLLERTINTEHQVDPEHRQLRVDNLVSPSRNTPLATLHTNTPDIPKQVPHQMSLMQNTKLAATTSKLRQQKENRLVTPSPNKPSVTLQNSNSNPTVELYDYPTLESHNSVGSLGKITGYGRQSDLFGFLKLTF